MAAFAIVQPMPRIKSTAAGRAGAHDRRSVRSGRSRPFMQQASRDLWSRGMLPGRSGREIRSIALSSKRCGTRVLYLPGSKQSVVDPAGDLRFDGAAPDASGSRRVPRRSIDRTPTNGWSTGCWLRRLTASAGPATGSTWFATPNLTDIGRTRFDRQRGAIAITSCTLSIPTSPTTGS